MKKENKKHKLIFIVEDNEMYSFMLDYMLSNEHTLRCVRFEKGEECIRSLQLNPDMIILDYVLPGITGLETFRKIRMNKPEVPVVVLTGHYDVQTARQFLEEGVCDYMLKEENAVQKVKSLVVNTMERQIENEVAASEKIARRKNIKIALIALIALVVVAGLIWFVNG